MNCISECVLNVLNNNVALTVCVKCKLSKHKLALRKLLNKKLPIIDKKRLIVHRGGFIIPLLGTVLPTLASLISAK